MKESPAPRQDARTGQFCLQAFGHLQVAEYARAERAGRRAVHRQEDNWRAHALLSLALRGLGRFGEAEKHARRALEISPGKPNLLFVLGLCLWSAGEPLEARKLFEEALQKSPERSDMLMDYAGFLLHQRQFDQALAMAEKARALAPEHPKLPLLLSCATEGVWRPEVDAPAFRPPIPLPEDRPETFVRLGTAHMDSGYFDLALDEFSRALDLDEDHEEARSLYATTFYMRKSGFYAWARSWRRGLARPHVLLLGLLPLLLLGGGGWFLYSRGSMLFAGLAGAAAALYVLSAFYLLVVGSRRLSGQDFLTIVQSRNLTIQGRRKHAEKMVDELDELRGRRERRRGDRATDAAAARIPRQIGTGEDVTRVRRQLEDRSRSFWHYSNTFFGLSVLSLLVLAWTVLRKNTFGLLVTDEVLLAERIAAASTVVFAAGAFWFRTKAREMSERL